MSAKEVSPRLGRGLAALMGDTTRPAPTTQPTPGIATIPIEMLEAGPFQPRGAIDPVSLTDLVGSIRARGILQPLLARPHPSRPGHYQIIAGERRWRAAQAAGLHEVPVLVRNLLDVEAMAAALVENLQRQDLNAIEEAEGYNRLLDEFAMTQETLAQAVGKSRSHIANTLRLLHLPASVQQEVRNGTLSAGHARALVSHPDPVAAASAVIARGLNVRQTESLASRTADPSTPASDRAPRAKDLETQALERSLSLRLGLKVDISFDGRAGTLRLHYNSLEQLDRLVELLERS
jgi:ParB family chromosome partitioning protein